MSTERDVCGDVVKALLDAPDLVCELPAGHAGAHRQGETTWTPRDHGSRAEICGEMCPMLNADGGLIHQPCELAAGHEGRHRITPRDMGSRFMTMAAILSGSGVFATEGSDDA